ncbi:TonB-dependent siderophore receptor [Phenylobacterium sp. LjRoot225]|uniref:TonB-dependent siderophore receptor n=1 Tax=Phenylobacterium sp. LjRoot225 TaxID=3342285 RepID=UPI003ECC1CF6
MSRSRGLRLALLASGALFSSLSTAHAVEANPATTIDEVVVLAHRQQYRGDVPIQELPQNVAVLSAKLLQDVNITRLDAALEMVSGVEHQNNFGGLWDAFAVRGFVGDPNVPSGYLLNGFSSGRGFGGPRDASNIDHIEVMKGPTSALFGRGEPGGTINVITKKPLFTPQGTFSASAGSYDTYRAEGDFTGAINDAVAVRINGAYEQGDSFRDTINYKKYVVTPSVLLKLGPSTTLTYDLEVVHQEVPFDRGVLALNGDLHTIPKDRFLGEPGDGPIKVDAVGHQLQLNHELSDHWTVMAGVGYRVTQLKGFSTEAELTRSRQRLYVDGQTLSRQRRYRDWSTNDLTLRAEVDGRFETFGLPHHVLIGADSEELHLHQLQLRFRPPAVAAQTSLAAGNAVNIFSPAYGNQPTVAPFWDFYEQQNAYGIYVQDQVDLTDQLKFRAGARYDYYRQSILDRRTSAVTGQKVTVTNPQLGLVYAPNKVLSFYAGYGKGFRPNSGQDVSNSPFTPERSKSYEVGVKFQDPEGRINGTLSVYDMKKSGLITADPVNTGFSLAIGKAKSKGVELDVNGELPGKIKYWLSYAYTDAKMANDILDPDFGLTVPAGARLLGIPKTSGNILVFRDFELGDDRVVSLGGGVKYVGKRLGETGTDFMLPSYALVKAFASYAPNDSLKLSAEVDNLFDKNYFPASYSRLWILPGTPRTFSVKATYSFR